MSLIQPIAIAVALAILLASAPSRADSEPRRGKMVAADLVAGLPQMLGLELSFIGLPRLAAGVSFGSLPVNSLMNKKIPLEPVTIALTTGDSFQLKPRASYLMYGTSAFLRFLPANRGFFAELAYSSWTFSGRVAFDLVNPSTGATSKDIVSGTVKITQPAITPAMGYQFFFDSGLFIDLGLGVVCLLSPRYSVEIGGTAASVLPVVPGASEAFDGAKSSISAQVADGVASYRAAVKFLPSLFVAVGWSI